MSRSKYKGPFFKVNLIKNQQKKKIYHKNVMILPEYVNYLIQLHTGKNFVNMRIKPQMVGFKFGEFLYTRKRHIYKKKKK